MPLYNKYRPSKLVEFLGNQGAKEIVQNLISSKSNIPAAFIFAGNSGTGKTTLGRILARGLNCIKKNKAPCGVCSNCVHELHEYDGGSLSVDNIRNLLNESKLYPIGGKYRIIIIDEVHQISTAGFTSMLKVLEEAPTSAKFIFCTTNLAKIPETIQSRCLILPISQATQQEKKQWLETILIKEQIILDKNIKNRLITIPNNRLILSTLTSLNMVSKDIQENIINSIGSVDHLLWNDIINGKDRIDELLKTLQNLNSNKEYLENLYVYFKSKLINNIDKNKIRIIRAFSILVDTLNKGSSILPELFWGNIFKICSVFLVDNSQSHSTIMATLNRWGYFNILQKYSIHIKDIQVVDRYTVTSNIIDQELQKLTSNINILLADIKNYELE